MKRKTITTASLPMFDWLAPRQRGYHPGDVQPDGSICAPHGYALRYADIWVSKRQSERARTFGWRVIGRRRKLVLVRRFGGEDVLSSR